MHKLILYYQHWDSPRGYYIEKRCDFVTHERRVAFFEDYSDALKFIKIKSIELGISYVDDVVNQQNEIRKQYKKDKKKKKKP